MRKTVVSFLTVSVLMLGLQSHAFTSQNILNPNIKPFNFTQSNFKKVILNGNLVNKGSRISSHLVYIKTLDSNNKLVAECTGAIISQNLVLTAGHCLKKQAHSVKVYFGIDGSKESATHTQTSSLFYSTHKNLNFKEKSNNNSYLSYNENSYQFFKNKRKEWTNWAYEDSPVSAEEFFDLGVIKISTLPRGYSPVKMFKGNLHFSQNLYMAGYGQNSRHLNKNDNLLRWSKVSLIGHYTVESSPTIGLKYYSKEEKNACFGDSGGPVLHRDKNDVFSLVAINTSSVNNCANASLGVIPTSLFGWLEGAVERLGLTYRL